MRFAQIQHPDVRFVYINLQESDYLLKYTDKKVFKRDLNEHEQWIADGLVKKDILKRVKIEGKIAFIRNFKLNESQIKVSLYKDMLNEGWKEKALGAVAGAALAAGGVNALKTDSPDLPQPDLQVKTQLTKPDPNAPKYDLADVKRRISGIESGGRNIQNQSGSSAHGHYQILKPTFKLVQNINPEVANMSWEQFKANEKGEQDKVMDTLIKDYEKTLTNQGHDVNPTSLYMTHRLGAGNVNKTFKALKDIGSNATLADVYGDKGLVYKQNPDMKPDTRITDFIEKYRKRMTGDQ